MANHRNTPTKNPHQLAEFNEICALTRQSRSTLTRTIASDATFPRPIKLSAARQGRVYFRIADVENWIDAQVAKAERDSQ